jgi:hypothetical protein
MEPVVQLELFGFRRKILYSEAICSKTCERVVKNAWPLVSFMRAVACDTQ